MKSLPTFLVLLLLSGTVSAQLYFPPKLGPQWDTVNPETLGWCTAKLDTLKDFLASTNTKGFIILKDGKIAFEHYIGTFTQDSLWYWASAGKSLFALLAGRAQELGYFTLSDTVSTYLGSGWTSCTPIEEQRITLADVLRMQSGLQDNVPDPGCFLPSCLQCIALPGTRWAYHNAPYTLLHTVLENATGQTLQQFTNQQLGIKTGIVGGWFTYNTYTTVFGSRLRDMARFGLLIQNNGIWAGDTVLGDTAFFSQMLHPSQAQNKSYGYLWWLNGQASFMLPQSQLVFQGPLIPNAPADTWCALGKNDQKLYISKSTGLVIARMGNDAGNPGLAPTLYDNLLWAQLNTLFCGAIGAEEHNPKMTAAIWTNTAAGSITLRTDERMQCSIFGLNGQCLHEASYLPGTYALNLPAGVYVAVCRNENGRFVQKLVVF